MNSDDLLEVVFVFPEDQERIKLSAVPAVGSQVHRYETRYYITEVIWKLGEGLVYAQVILEEVGPL